MNIVVKDLVVNRIELDEFLDDLILNANRLDLKDITFNNLILRKDKVSVFPSNWNKDVQENVLQEDDILIV